MLRPRPRLLFDFVTPGRAVRYGTEHRCQQAELHLPRGREPHPVVVTIHGGSWSAGYGKVVMRGLAGDLVRRGYAVWNIEYRKLGRGEGGGWPATFEDVALAIDHLATLAEPLDLGRVIFFGHSAGGQLALWAASRGNLPSGAPGAGPRVEPVAAVSAAGVADLAESYRETPRGAVGRLMGGGPDEFPERYAVADPIALVPLAIPVLVVQAPTTGPCRCDAAATTPGRRSPRAAMSRRSRFPARRALTAATSSRRARAGPP
jgi:acetyl esterase/lipase